MNLKPEYIPPSDRGESYRFSPRENSVFSLRSENAVFPRHGESFMFPRRVGEDDSKTPLPDSSLLNCRNEEKDGEEPTSQK